MQVRPTIECPVCGQQVSTTLEWSLVEECWRFATVQPGAHDFSLDTTPQGGHVLDVDWCYEDERDSFAYFA